MNIIKDLVNRLNKRMIHPEKDEDLLLDELKNIGVEFIDTDEDTFWKYNERQTPTEANKHTETKQLIIGDVSGSIRTDVYGDVYKSDDYIDGDQDCVKCKYYNIFADLPPCSKCQLGASEYYR